MTDLILYHNPRCSKSRAALALLEAAGLQPQLRRYLDAPPTIEELQALLRTLQLPARELLRNDEEACRRLGLDDPACSEQELLAAIAAEPALLQRPIAVCAGRAVIGRPPERVLELLS